MIRKAKLFVRKLLGIKTDTDFYSQGGEDAIVWLIFSSILRIQKGFYVDVGAYHPFSHSNTYLLYKAGWRGMNIDPRYGMKKLFDLYRPEDINVEAGIAEENTELDYFILDEDSTMNSFSKDNLKRIGQIQNITRTVKVPVYRLDYLMSQHQTIDKIDYLNIDAEGFEMEILRTVDFDKHTPSLISIEQNNTLTLKDVFGSQVCEFMATKNYTPIAKNIIMQDVSTVFYLNDTYLI